MDRRIKASEYLTGVEIIFYTDKEFNYVDDTYTWANLTDPSINYFIVRRYTGVGYEEEGPFYDSNDSFDYIYGLLPFANSITFVDPYGGQASRFFVNVNPESRWFEEYNSDGSDPRFSYVLGTIIFYGNRTVHLVTGSTG